MANMDVHLRPADSARELARFIDVPWRIDRALGADLHWVPPLRSGVKAMLDPRHPFWERNRRQLWVAYQNGRPVGRIAAILNREHQDYWRDKTGFWGLFETIDRQEVADALLAAAEEWLAQEGCTVAVGPVNPSPHYGMGILIEGFDAPPYLLLAHNRPYYPVLLAAAGYEKAADFHSYMIRREEFRLASKIQRVSETLKRRWGVTVRTGEMQHFAREAAIIHRIYNASMSGQWGFTPIGAGEFDAFAAELKKIIDPDLVLFAEHRGEPIGFLLALPNLNEILIRIRDGRLFPFGFLKLLRGIKRIKSIRVMLIGVLPEWQRRGIGSLLYDELAPRALAKGYTALEMSWVSEDNVLMKRAASLLGGSVHKTYRVYRKNLDAVAVRRLDACSSRAP